MIVVCSTCQARFKVADDKIGPRGAKVRCSKCQTVFVVHRDLGVIPAEAPQAAPPPPAASPAGGIDLDFDGAPGSGVRPNGFSGNPFARAAAADPFAAAPPSPPAPDPFGAADPFAAEPAAPQPPPAPEADPFAAHDPFSAGSGGSLGSVDPFVATVANAAPGIPASAVTDLSDLLGSAPPEPAEPPPAAPPSEPSGILDSGFDFDPSAGAEPGLDAAPPAAPPAPSFDAGADLALDERTPAQGIAAHGTAPSPMLGFGDVDPFEDQGGPPAAPAGSASSFASADFDAFGDGSEAEAPPPPQRASPPREPAADEPRPPTPAAEPAPAVETTGEAVAAGGFQRSSRARAIAVNAVSLVALLAVVLGMLALWRGVRPGTGGLFRPTMVLGAIGDAATFGTAQVRSGIYERTDGTPLIFVTGRALSHATAPVAGLRVGVEVVSKGAVVARGEARAGPLPSPEELAGLKDAASLGAVLAQKGSKPPAQVKPGDSVPFLVAISDFPADVAGAALRVTVEPVEDAPAPSPPPAEPAPAPPASPEGAPKP